MNIPSLNYSVFKLIRDLIFDKNVKACCADFNTQAGRFCHVAERLELGSFIYFFLYKEKLIPPEYEEKFSATFRAMSAVELRRLAELNRILKILNENNILAAPLKGAALAYSSYPHPALRGMCDFDILIKPDEIHTAWLLMQKHGFTTDGIENNKHLPILFSPSGQALELHRHISNDASYPYEYLWEESRAVPFLNSEAVLLSPELNILHAIDHALYEDLICGFRVFIDIAFIISREDPSPEKLRQLALKLDMYPALVFFMNIFPGFFPEKYCFKSEKDSEDILEKGRFLILNSKRLQNLNRHDLMLSRDYVQLNRKKKLIYISQKLIKKREIMEYKYKRPMNLLNFPAYYCREIFSQFGKFINFSKSCPDAVFMRDAGIAQQHIKAYLHK